jgi:IS5 family transposase
VAAGAGFYSAKNVAQAEEMGVKRVSVPNRSTKSAARRNSLRKRRHGLRRSLDKKGAGMKRWVGLGVIADNLINIGRVLAN